MTYFLYVTHSKHFKFVDVRNGARVQKEPPTNGLTAWLLPPKLEFYNAPWCGLLPNYFEHLYNEIVKWSTDADSLSELKPV